MSYLNLEEFRAECNTSAQIFSDAHPSVKLLWPSQRINLSLCTLQGYFSLSPIYSIRMFSSGDWSPARVSDTNFHSACLFFITASPFSIAFLVFVQCDSFFGPFSQKTAEYVLTSSTLFPTSLAIETRFHLPNFSQPVRKANKSLLVQVENPPAHSCSHSFCCTLVSPSFLSTSIEVMMNFRSEMDLTFGSLSFLSHNSLIFFCCLVHQLRFLEASFSIAALL
mmetsp:Transcript_27758/g.49012  ORF Transcript_27758/g.49012 Transcript_27758/m.49012 type:complete len:223 (+) Transcript_27758:351-1019(+)